MRGPDVEVLLEEESIRLPFLARLMRKTVFLASRQPLLADTNTITMPPKASAKGKSAPTLKPHATTTKAKAGPPKNWPPHLTYLTSPVYSPKLPAEVKLSLNPQNAKEFHPAHPSLAIKPISTPGHPAQGQSGLFALKKIPANTHLLDYIGHITIPPETSQTSDYSLSLDRYQSVSIDAEKMGNEARFVNDFRGVPNVKGPNAQFVDVERGREKRIGIKSLREIGKGEELLVSYGKGFWTERAKEWGAGEGEEEWEEE